MRKEHELVISAVAGRRPNGRGVVRANCPFCEDAVGKVDRKQCLQLESTGWWKCYRCDTRGKIDEDSMPFDIATLAANAPAKAEIVHKLPDGFVPLWKPEGKAISCQPAWRHLRTRAGITPELIAEVRIGACVRGLFAGRVVVPIYRGGRLAGAVGRSWHKQARLKYRYTEGFDRAATLYNEEALYVETARPVLVVEGVFDTFPFWPHAVAVLGKPSSQQLDMMLAAKRPIFVVLDGDAHREGTSLALWLRHHGKQAASLRLDPGVDPDEAIDHVNAQAKLTFPYEEA